MPGDDHTAYQHEARQWDIRLNVPNDEYLQSLVENIMLENVAGKFKYILVGGLECGTKPGQSDYQVRHIHIAVIFHNRASKGSIIKNWGIKEGNGYYMVPRNQALSYAGWKEHHTKEHSKIDPEAATGRTILEYGELPKDKGEKRKADFVVRNETEKKMKIDDIMKDIRKMLEDKVDDKEIFLKYPKAFTQWGEKLKSLIFQKRAGFFNTTTDPHLWVHGYPGSGKTSILAWLYPKTYKKNPGNNFWDLYDETEHDHVMLEDLDHDNVEKMGIQFLKTICDEAGFPINQKYKTPQPTRSTILVTSQYTICDIINGQDNTRNVDPEGKKAALKRRFWEIRVDQLHRLLNVKLINKYEQGLLKAAGNDDPSKLFMDYDYIQDMPTGQDLKPIEHYQQVIRDTYYR